MDCKRCVFPNPTPEYINRGLNLPPGSDATLNADEYASLLDSPTTKLSNR